MSALAQLLLAARSHDINVRGPAEQQLQAAEHNNFPEYMGGLCQELGNEQLDAGARQLAGIMLKNCMDARTEKKKQAFAERYLNVAEQVRATLKNMIAGLLQNSLKAARSTAAMVIGKIAAIELPKNLWPGLVTALLGNIANQQNPFGREASFEALGYVCEECPEHIGDSIGILNSIASGLAPEEKNNQIKLAAIRALMNSLDAVKTNFDNPGHRNIIMQMVFAAAAVESKEVRLDAYRCLVAIAEKYYQFLSDFMEFIFNMTSHGIQQEDPDIACQGVEFWSTICEKEMDILEEIEDFQAASTEQKGTQQPRQCFQFMNAALRMIMPMLLASLTKQSDELDDETWIPAKAAAFTIGLIAQTTKDACVDHVYPFITGNVRNPNWRFREAAILAFAYLLEGPNQEKMTPIVRQAFPTLLEAMGDENDLIKDTAAWTLGRVCDLFAHQVINAQSLPVLIIKFHEGLQLHPSIAKNVAWAVQNLAEAYPCEAGSTTSPLSQYFQDLVGALLKLSEQVDEPKLVEGAFTAITELITHSAPDCAQLLPLLLDALITRLGATFQQIQQGHQHPQTISAQVQVQGLICGVLQALLRKIAPAAFEPHADNTMHMLLQVLNNEKAEVLEDAIHTVGTVADCAGAAFTKYLEAFFPHLLKGLGSVEDVYVCTNSVVCLQSIAYAVTHYLVPCGDELMKVLLTNLQNETLDRSVKPKIIMCLADLAFVLGPHFERYVEWVIHMLVQASEIKMEATEDNIDWQNELRGNIFNAYSSILLGLCTDPNNNKAANFANYLEKIYEFFVRVDQDPHRDSAVLKKAISLILDIAQELAAAPRTREMLKMPSIANLVRAGQASTDPKTASNARDTEQAIMKLL